MDVGSRGQLKLGLNEGRGLGPWLYFLLSVILSLTLIVFTLPFKRGGTFGNISSKISLAVIFYLPREDSLQVDDFLGNEASLQL